MEMSDLLPCGHKQQFQTKLRYLLKKKMGHDSKTLQFFKLAVARRPVSPQIQVSETEPNLAFGRQYAPPGKLFLSFLTTEPQFHQSHVSVHFSTNVNIYSSLRAFFNTVVLDAACV